MSEEAEHADPKWDNRERRLPGLLRSYAALYHKPYGDEWAQDSDQAPVMEEAADEMERLREERAEEVEELGNVIAYLRDMFPVPDSGTQLEREWLSAMGSPQDAVAYVATRIRELHNE